MSIQMRLSCSWCNLNYSVWSRKDFLGRGNASTSLAYDKPDATNKGSACDAIYFTVHLPRAGGIPVGIDNYLRRELLL